MGSPPILDEMRTDERYADIKPVTSPIGDVYYHSDKHMSGYYAVVLSRVAAKDPVATVAAMVRDESRIYPRPTCIEFFMEPMFKIPPGDLKAVFDEMVQKPEYSDIKLMVHPETGGVYAYSSQYLERGRGISDDALGGGCEARESLVRKPGRKNRSVWNV